MTEEREDQVENLKDERIMRRLETVTSRLDALLDRLEKVVVNRDSNGEEERHG